MPEKNNKYCNRLVKSSENRTRVSAAFNGKINFLKSFFCFFARVNLNCLSLTSIYNLEICSVDCHFPSKEGKIKFMCNGN